MSLWAVTFDWTISFGTVLMTLTLVAAIVSATYALIYSIKSKLEVFQATLKDHAEALHKHDTMLGLYETRIFDLVGSLQRLIGRFEALEHRSASSKS